MLNTWLQKPKSRHLTNKRKKNRRKDKHRIGHPHLLVKCERKYNIADDIVVVSFL
jgi:hypothetical protein